MAEQDTLETGLLFAVVLDGEGGGREVGWDEIESWTPDHGLLWLHLDFRNENTKRWLEGPSGIDPVLARTIVAADARPRVVALDDALMVSLRGVNLNPGANPEDMVGIRVWVDKDRIITVRHRRLMAAQDLRERLAQGHGPKTSGEFLSRLADSLIDRMGPVVGELEDEVDDLEDRVLTKGKSSLRSELSDIRRTAITLRRYLAPQREAMARLMLEDATWLSAMDKAMLREVADRTTRYVEDLDAARERAAVVHEELAAQLADQMNRTMYVLTVVAAILLPPSLLTGLLGINVGGMPGVDSDLSFTLVAVAIVAIGVVEYLVLRWLKWI